MITFREIEKEDLLLLKEWRNSDLVRPYVREYRYLNDSDQEIWFDDYFKSRRKSDFDQELFIICANKKCEDEFVSIPIGVGGYTRIEWRNRRAELTFYIGDINYDAPEQIKHCLKLLIDKCFNEFGFNKITWPVYGHDPKLKIYQEIFDTEAVLKEEYFWNGKFQDRYYLSLINKNA